MKRKTVNSIAIIEKVIRPRKMRWAQNVARMGGMRNTHDILTGKFKGKRPLGRSRGRWEYNIRMDLREIGWECVDWIRLTQDTDQWGGGGGLLWTR
jgi:hypothetical protein